MVSTIETKTTPFSRIHYNSSCIVDQKKHFWGNPTPTRLSTPTAPSLSVATSWNTPRTLITKTSTNGSSLRQQPILTLPMTTSPPPPLLYEVEEIDDAITHAAATYRHDLTSSLSFAEWRTTRSQHPTMYPSHPLDAPPSEWNIYSPEHSHHSTPGRNINAFREAIRLNPTSHHTTHPLTTGSLTITDRDLMDILDEYQSPLVLTIDGSFKPSPTLNVYPPRQPHPPTMAHAAASVTITALNNSHPTRP